MFAKDRAAAHCKPCDPVSPARPALQLAGQPRPFTGTACVTRHTIQNPKPFLYFFLI